MNFFKNYVFLLFLILLLSAFLRFYHLGAIPPSLYTDEADQGYNAYSLMLTGSDEHGVFLPVSLRSFGDWKPPLPTYLMIPFVFFLGLTETSVRLPSAVLGTASVFLAWLLLKTLFKSVKGSGKISLLSAFVLAVSPWHIFQSRAAMLVSVAFFFLLTGIYLFIKGKGKVVFYYWGVFFLSLSIYSYYGLRVVVPLITVLLIFNRHFLTRIKIWLPSLLLGLIILLPLGVGFIRNPDVLLGRAKTVSVFYDQGPKLRLWELISQDTVNTDPILARFFHNRVYLYAKEIAGNFFAHFDPLYLFIKGDNSQPFTIPGMGILYFLDGILIILGLVFLFGKKLPYRFFLILFLIISVIPASLTFMVPSSNRTFNAVFPFSVFIALGVFRLTKIQKLSFTLTVLTSVLYTVSFTYFMNIYFIKLPKNFSRYWNFGWRQAVSYVDKHGGVYDNIIVPDKSGMPYIYFLFYDKYDPLKFQKESRRVYAADRFGFEHLDGFDKFLFPGEFDWLTVKDNPVKNSLYIVPVADLPVGESAGEDIKYPDNTPVLKIFRYE